MNYLKSVRTAKSLTGESERFHFFDPTDPEQVKIARLWIWREVSTGRDVSTWFPFESVHQIGTKRDVRARDAA